MIITIGRQLAAGGREIGQMIAKRLNLHYFDKELLIESARESGIAHEMFLRADEHYNLFTLALKTDNQRLFQFQSDTIRRLATEGNSLFMGRAADYILRDRDDLFSVFLTADIKDRIKRVMKHDNLNEQKATRFIKRTDRRRAAYYNFYTGRRWGEALGYDICINTSSLGIDNSVEIIVESINRVFCEHIQ